MIGNQSALICPVCGGGLVKEGKTLRCPAGHSYDYAKSGYVNLLMSQQGRLHGDDRPMVRARTVFLSAGHYRPLLDAIVEAALPGLPQDVKVFDAGCGEGWYTQELYETLKNKGLRPECVGVDISRDALNSAAKRPFPGEFAVASLYHIPLENDWCDLIVNVFAPDCAEEFSRILKPGGVYVKVIPLEDHLLELKQAVYDSVYENEVSTEDPDGFELESNTVLRWNLCLPDNETVKNLFFMTPYARKTSPADIAKLDGILHLSTTVSFSVLRYKKV